MKERERMHVRVCVGACAHVKFGQVKTRGKRIKQLKCVKMGGEGVRDGNMLKTLIILCIMFQT